ncbi:TPA: hypothetical protein ACPVZQ_005224 [Vibrio parahaemolyticus]|uniref:ABC transporter ATP-binding protein n=1 Tax=Vibrio parahaemolyticus TaxID=670 RepID=UPI001E5E314B|nr:ABC transporter ATP-binding protein [Vibrio parahaemolyticus]
MSQPIIQMKNVIKEFTVGGGFAKEETFRALQGVSFDLYAGRTLALVGESGCGQRQRVNLARALAVGSQIILADEPTSMLDVSIRLGVLNLMQRMKQELGIGFLYITHDLATAHYIAEETAVMYKGQIVEWGDTHAILKNPQHPYTKLLISAVPDPDLPFGNLVKNEPNYSIDADEIRHRSSVVVDEYDQVGPNHFVKQWIEAA